MLALSVSPRFEEPRRWWESVRDFRRFTEFLVCSAILAPRASSRLSAVMITSSPGCLRSLEDRSTSAMEPEPAPGRWKPACTVKTPGVLKWQSTRNLGGQV